MILIIILPFIIYDVNDNLIGERVFIAAVIMGIQGFLCFQYMIKNTEIQGNTDIKVDGSVHFNVFHAIINFAKNRPAMGATIVASVM